MDPLTLTIVAAVSGVGALCSAASIRGRLALGRVWLEAARQAGLTEVVLRRRGRWPVAAEGRHGALAVRLDSRLGRRARRSTRIVVSRLTRRLEMHPASLFKDGGGRRDIRVGDNAFDAEIFVSGDTAVASGLLDGRTRDLVRGLFAKRVSGMGHNLIEEGGVRLGNGQLVSERSLGGEHELVAAHLLELLALAARLVEPDDVLARLAANAREDRNPAVRRISLLRLAEQADRNGALPALRHALEDADEDVRLEAALALGVDGHAALIDIARAEVPIDANAARATRALGPALPTEHVRFVLARAIRARHLETAAACLVSLGQRGPEQAPMIGRVLEMERGELAIVAARALGAVGAAPSIVLLREAEARTPRDAALGRASREAIAAIRSRLSGAEAGQVTLAGDDAGHVSFAGDEAGRVSVPPAGKATG